MNWWLWRVALPGAREQLGLTIADVRRMSFVEVFECHVVLDTLPALKPDAPAGGGR